MPYEDRERLNMRMRALANSFTKTDRVLTGDPKIKVLALDSGTAQQHQIPLVNAPGWSEYPNIVLNVEMFKNIGKTSTLVGLLGLNYHELAHIMFTPRGFKSKITGTHGSIWGTAFNLLEDQRIESFFTAIYEPAGKFFTETFIRFGMADENMWDYLFLYSYGRGFLPLDIRQEFEARFLDPSLIDEIKDIVDKYKALRTFSTGVSSGSYKLINRMVRVLQQVYPPNAPQDCIGAGQEEGQPDKQQEREARLKDSERRRKEEKTGEDQSKFWDEDDDDDNDESEAEDGSDDSGEESDEHESGSGTDSDSEDSDSEDGDSDDDDLDGGEESDGGDSEDFSDGTSDDGAESGVLDGGEDDSDDGDSDSDYAGEGDDESASGEPLGDDDEENPEAGNSSEVVEQQYDDDELRDYLTEISEAIEEDDNVRSEVSRIHTAMNDDTNIDVIDFGKAPHKDVEPSVEAKQAVSKVQKEFSRLWADVEPGWQYGSEIGKLNTYRAMHDPDNLDEMFDEWDEGREVDLGLEVFISLDCSSSMSGQEIALASEAMWCLKRSLDEIDAKVTVVGYHEFTVGLFDRNSRVGKEVPLWTHLVSDTRPAHSIKLARTVLNVSPMPNKLFVMITDGGWSYWDEEGVGADYKGLVESVPGVKMYVGVGSGGASNNTEVQQSFNVRSQIRNPLALVPIVEKTVQHMIKERLNRR